MPSNPWHEEDDTCLCEHCQEPFTLVPLDVAVWNWREKLSLTTLDDCAERLGQEAALYAAINLPDA